MQVAEPLAIDISGNSDGHCENIVEDKLLLKIQNPFSIALIAVNCQSPRCSKFQALVRKDLTAAWRDFVKQRRLQKHLSRELGSLGEYWAAR